MKNALRTFIASWYLLGWMVHIYLIINSPQLYSVFGSTALIPGYEPFWNTFIMSNITFWVLLLAVFELCVGLMMIYKGVWVKISLVFSILFNLFLIQMGLGSETNTFMSDFLSNRLPNLIMVVLQFPLLWGTYTQSIREKIKLKRKI